MAIITFFYLRTDKIVLESVFIYEREYRNVKKTCPLGRSFFIAVIVSRRYKKTQTCVNLRSHK